MKINSIRLENFRNLSPINLNFNNQVIIIKGENAQGKTSLLEGIYSSILMSSFRTKNLLDCINFEKDYFSTSVSLDKSGTEHKIIGYISNDKKSVQLDSQKLKEHYKLFSNFCVVCFLQDDKDIIVLGPDKRRRYINQILSFSNSDFLTNYKNLQFLLKSRNAALKAKDIKILETLDEKFALASFEVFSMRGEVMGEIQDRVNEIFREIFSIKYNFSIVYDSSLNGLNSAEDVLNLLQSSREREFLYGYTLNGVQKDDFKFLINGKAAKEVLSSGQIRLLAIILKFALIEIISKKLMLSPVILLDDALLELDEKRKMSIFEYLLKYKQIFYTFLEADTFYKDFSLPCDKKILTMKAGAIVD